jgi:hypothetical protein
VIKKLFIVVVIVVGAYQWWGAQAITHPPGVIAPRQPVQSRLDVATPFAHKGYTLTPLAGFSVEARVLGREDYSFDRESELAPIDLALGWGPMSDQAVLDGIEISQSSRFYWWKTRDFPIPRRAIETHSANMHLIPASDEVLDQLERVREGQVVNFKGYLVRAVAPDSWRWQSSMTREDTGNGACELVWVEALHVN